MPLSHRNALISKHVGTLCAALLVGALTLGYSHPASAHEHEKMCGPVTDGDGEPVVQSDGDILLHGGSFPCPPEEVQVETTISEIDEPAEPTVGTVYFDFDVAEPNADGDAALTSIIEDLANVAPRRVRVAGHADRSGPEPYNLDLSRRRAENVAKRLIAGGVPAVAVAIEAYGETRPAVATGDGVREPANRRAEIEAAFQ